MTSDEYDTIRRMQTWGGSFVKALAECFLRADPNNFKKLKDTFQEYWNEYSK